MLKLDMAKKYGCCNPVIWKHEDGWDVYAQEECAHVNGAWVPQWFDNPMVEDAPTKAAALKELQDWHVLGICMWTY